MLFCLKRNIIILYQHIIIRTETGCLQAHLHLFCKFHTAVYGFQSVRIDISFCRMELDNRTNIHNRCIHKSIFFIQINQHVVAVNYICIFFQYNIIKKLYNICILIVGCPVCSYNSTCRGCNGHISSCFNFTLFIKVFKLLTINCNVAFFAFFRIPGCIFIGFLYSSFGYFVQRIRYIEFFLVIGNFISSVARHTTVIISVCTHSLVFFFI